MPPDLFAPAGGGVAQLALPLPEDTLFDYAVPPALDADAEPGRRALVPFGTRRLVGVIVARRAMPEAAARGKLRPIASIVDPEPVLGPGLLAVLRELAADVLCPLGLALAAALPAGSAPRSRMVWLATPRGQEALRSGALRGPAAALLERLARRPLGAARPRALGAGVSAALGALERDRLVRRAPLEAGPSARETRIRVARVAPGIDGEATAATLARAPRQAALLRALVAGGPAPTAELAERFPGAPGLLRALAARGLVRLEDRLAPRDVLGAPLEEDRAVALTPEQAAAEAAIAAAVRARRAETFLLHGVTGSGKTEVYLRAVADALALGRQALVLVPEITLTHQILARLRGRFGDRLAVLHSGLRPAERLEQWQRLRRGRTPIAVGARSALFAPLENLGLVVIDEEHDAAYKNEEGFRYHARDLAARRAAEAGCPLVLGSATPSLETRFAADHGGVRRLVLPHRIGGRPLPAVEIVDLERERASAPRGRKLVLTRPLRRALAEALAEGGQAILFLNRRGFSTKIFCFECGHAERCKHCDIALVYHAAEQRLRCHYCGYEIAPPERCGGCGAPETALLGLGTERLEEEVRRAFPEARIARLDRDTAARRGGAEGVLRALREGRIDVLVGTQMVAKGHDFPGVRVVGVVAADLGLHLPDFRAAERTFQLLTQVAGRAGRGDAPGRVVLQTFVPEHYAIRPVRDHDYEGFYAEELRHREALGYPPFGRLALALVQAAEREDAEAGAARLARVLREEVAAGASAADLELLGPAPAPLARLRGRWRFQLLLKGEDAAVRRAARRLAAEAARLPRGVRASVDVNPVTML